VVGQLPEARKTGEGVTGAVMLRDISCGVCNHFFSMYICRLSLPSSISTRHSSQHTRLLPYRSDPDPRVCVSGHGQLSKHCEAGSARHAVLGRAERLDGEKLILTASGR